MKDINLMHKLLKNGYECEYLDFKKAQYRKENFNEFIIDIMSMANSDYSGDKYIIIGVKDKPNSDREIVGIDSEDVMDDATYQQVVFNNIEPEIKFEYFCEEIEEKLLGIFKVYNSNTNRPYMLKKKYRNLNEGLCKVRRGSTNSFVTRNDIDKFYLSREKFEVQFMEKSLVAVNDETGCARTSITIKNHTKFPVVINYGLITIFNMQGEELTKHGVYGFRDEIRGADFQITLPPMDEKLGDLYVGFSSIDCLRLGLDQYGSTNKKFKFELVLIDTNDNEYTTYVDGGWVFAKGKVLWKVEMAAKENQKKKRRRFFK